MHTSISQYFIEKLGVDKAGKCADWPDWSINTGCGQECKKLIDAASKMLDLLDNPSKSFRCSVIDEVADTVSVYIYG